MKFSKGVEGEIMCSVKMQELHQMGVTIQDVVTCSERCTEFLQQVFDQITRLGYVEESADITCNRCNFGNGEVQFFLSTEETGNIAIDDLVEDSHDDQHEAQSEAARNWIFLEFQEIEHAIAFAKCLPSTATDRTSMRRLKNGRFTMQVDCKQKSAAAIASIMAQGLEFGNPIKSALNGEIFIAADALNHLRKC